MIRRYEDLLDVVLTHLSSGNHELAVELAELPLSVKGFGAIKLEAARSAEAREKTLLDGFLKAEHDEKEPHPELPEIFPHADR